jgi:hypothetical protein
MSIIVPYPIFLVLLVIAITYNILLVFCYGKTKQYKRQLDQCRNQNNKSASFIKPASSAAEQTIINNQSNGERINCNIKGKRRYASRITTIITENINAMVLAILSIYRYIIDWLKRSGNHFRAEPLKVCPYRT